MIDSRANAKISFLLLVVAYEFFVLPALNIPNGADDHTISIVVLMTISLVLNFITYHDSSNSQPIFVVLSVSFMIATGLFVCFV